MKSPYESNLALLRSRDAALAGAVERASDDGSVAALEGKNGSVPEVAAEGKKIAVHSRFDPVKEAERFAAEIDAGSFDLFVVAGFGFGYHLEPLLAKAGRDATVLVLEKSALMLRKACESRDLAAVLGDGRVYLALDPKEDDIARLLQGRSTRRVSFLTHRGSHQADPHYYANTMRIAKSYLSTKDVNIATLAKFEKTWSLNIARNIAQVTGLPGVERFYGKFAGVPAIVVAAGPTLSRSLEFIKKNAGKAVIVAVDTSYRLLTKNGIEPHFCVTVDPQPVNARYFEGDTGGRTILVADPSSHPSVFRLFRGRAVMAATAFPMMKWIEEICGGRGEIAHGGSVSTNAYDFAKRLGASPVVMVGQDLAFTGGYAHARGSYLDEQVHLKSTRFGTAEMFNRRQLTALPKIFVRGILGGTVHTNQKMMIFLSWFERRNDPELVNATVDGALMKGVRHARQDDIALSSAADPRALVESLYSAQPEIDAAGNRKGVDDAGAAMLDELESMLPVLRRAGKLSEDLVEAVGPRSRDGSKASYIIKKLDEADRAIQSRVGVKDMIGMTIQRVIHTITEGHDAGGDGEEGLSEGERVARRSLYFYRGLLEGAEFNFRVLGKMRKILSGS